MKIFYFLLSLAYSLLKPLSLPITLTKSNFSLRSLIPISSNLNYLPYYEILTIDFKLGTPGQSFRGLVDTGSIVLWVKKKTVNNSEFNCFEQNESSTFTDLATTFNINYVIGYANGTYGEDIISIAGYQFKFNFGIVDETDLNFNDIDGVFGFSHKYDIQSDKTITEKNSIIKQMINNNIISQFVFSIKLSPDLDNDYKGYIFLGDYHEDFANNIITCGLKGKGINSALWTCGLSYIIFGENDESHFKENSLKVKLDAVIDTGSNGSLLPKSLISKIIQKMDPIHCYQYDIEEYSTIACTSIDDVKNISFVFNGYAFKISKKNLFVYYIKKRIFLMNMDFSDKDYAIVGIQFFMDYHVLFDGERDLLSFYTENKNLIGDVRKFTTDADFKESNKTLLIVLCVVIPVVVIAITVVLIIWLCKRKKSNSSTSISITAVKNANKDNKKEEKGQQIELKVHMGNKDN